MCLGCDLLLWYHYASASPAQRKKIYENYILTQTTVNGKSVFHDRFVELSVMDLRLWQVSVEKITEMKIWPVMSGKFYSSRTLLSLSLCPEE